MLRVEDKYIIPKADFYELRERISSIIPTDHFSVNGGYKISSLYFDDLYDSNYLETVAGNPVRKKYRIRLYNDSFETIKLEVKTKLYSRISKESCSITRDEFNRLLSGETVEWGDTRTHPKTQFNEAILTRGLRPRVIVTYEREAFICEDGNTRITFDCNVRASDQIELFGQPNVIYDRLVDGDYVLEVKYDEFIPDYLLQVLEQNSMWQTSFSKYCCCREVNTGGEYAL